MTDARIPSGLWIEAKLRELGPKGIPYYITNKGAYYSGTVLLKINSLTDGCQVLSQIRDENGKLGWMVALKGANGEGWVAESEADAYIRRAVDRDPDIWAIEIDDRTKTNPFEGEILL